MKTLQSGNGFAILVDDEDLVRVSPFTWTAVRHKQTFYAIRVIREENGKQRQVYIHRFLLGLQPGDGIRIDHWDRNGLNNQRANLRNCSNAENSANRVRPQRSSYSSRFKGVRWTRGAWDARIRVNYKRIHLGRFKSEIEAAKAYNQAALLHFGEFAHLNVIPPTEQ